MGRGELQRVSHALLTQQRTPPRVDELLASAERAIPTDERALPIAGVTVRMTAHIDERLIDDRHLAVEGKPQPEVIVLPREQLLIKSTRLRDQLARCQHTGSSDLRAACHHLLEDIALMRHPGPLRLLRQGFAGFITLQERRVAPATVGPRSE